MKKAIFLAATLSALTIVGCNNAPEADEAVTGEQQKAATTVGTAYNIDTVGSSVEWLGSKPVGQHNGLFKISEGKFSVENGSISAGSFVISTASLTDLDLKAGEGKEKLEGHLKSADFLDTDKFPTAKFEITSVAPLANDSSATHTISGNLTLKDSTKNISFPAKLTIADNNLQAQANFNIDRTLWGLHYGNDKSLGDKFIRPEVNIKLNITANKL